MKKKNHNGEVFLKKSCLIEDGMPKHLKLKKKILEKGLSQSLSIMIIMNSSTLIQNHMVKFYKVNLDNEDSVTTAQPLLH